MVYFIFVKLFYILFIYLFILFYICKILLLFHNAYIIKTVQTR